MIDDKEPDWTGHLQMSIAFSSEGIRKLREALETTNVAGVMAQLARIGDLLLKAHTEVFAAANLLGPKRR